MRRLREQRGVAMVTVLLVMFVMATISVAAYTLAAGNLNHSAYDRKSDQAIQAAQGAVNAYIANLPRTTRLCNGVGISQTLSSTPRVTYQISSVHWSNDATTWSNATNQAAVAGMCTSSSTTKFGSVKQLVVVGSGSAGTGTQVVTRKWQSLLDLTAIKGGTTNAFFGNAGLCIVNNPTIMHNTTGNDAGVYSGGDLNTAVLCGNSNGNGSAIIEGNLYAVGNIGDSGNPMKGCVEGNVWAGGAIWLSNATIGACNGGSYPLTYAITANAPPNPTCEAKPNPTCYFQDSSGNMFGNVTAGGALSLISSMAYGSCISGGAMTWGGPSRCSTSRDPSNAYLPLLCSGTVGSGATACGTQNAAGVTAPASSEMPTFVWSSADWTGPYQVVTENSGNCANIATDIGSKIGTGVSGNYNLVFYINPSCALTIPNNTTYNLKGNVTIVTTGSFTSSNLTISSTAGFCNTAATDNLGNAMYPDSGFCQFDVIVPTDTVATPSTCTTASHPATWDISFGNQTNMSTVDTFNYTPCWLNLSQSANINGQGVAGVVNEGNNFKMTYHPMNIPGFLPAGYNAAPEYLRECGKTDSSGYC